VWIVGSCRPACRESGLVVDDRKGRRRVAEIEQVEGARVGREQEIIARQLALVRQEEAVQAREEAAQAQEDRAFEKMMLLMRQREEVEEMGMRHRKEYERVVHRD
jgi:predicted  nucleic acid-binding Zn-ribbon protein